MQDATRVNVLEASKNLVEEELNVLIAQHLVRLDDLGQVSFHEIGYHVQFVELLQRLRL